MPERITRAPASFSKVVEMVKIDRKPPTPYEVVLTIGYTGWLADRSSRALPGLGLSPAENHYLNSTYPEIVRLNKQFAFLSNHFDKEHANEYLAILTEKAQLAEIYLRGIGIDQPRQEMVETLYVFSDPNRYLDESGYVGFRTQFAASQEYIRRADRYHLIDQLALAEKVARQARRRLVAANI